MEFSLQVRIEFKTPTVGRNLQHSMYLYGNTIFLAPFYYFFFHFFVPKNLQTTTWCTEKMYVYIYTSKWNKKKKNGYYFLSPSDRYKLFMHFGISLPDKRKTGARCIHGRTAGEPRFDHYKTVFPQFLCSAQQTLCLLCFIPSRGPQLISKQDFTVMPTIRWKNGDTCI